MATLRVHGAITDIDADAWRELIGPEPSPFLQHSFLSLLEQSGCVSQRTGWIPRHLTVWRDNVLVAAAPAYIKLHSMGEFVYDWSWAHLARQLGVEYYPKLIVAVPFSPVAGPRLLVAPGEDKADIQPLLVAGLHELCRRLECHGVHILFNPEDEATALEELGAKTRLQTQSWWKNDDYTDFDDFLMRGLVQKRRKEVRRERKRLAETGVRMERLAGPTLRGEHIDAMYGFYANTCRMYGGNTYLERPFWRALKDSPFLEHVQLTVAWQEDVPIAGSFNVVGPRRLYGRYWGASEERKYLHFETCYYQGIEDSIARGLQFFEPGHGGRHKTPRGFAASLTRSSHWLTDSRLSGVLDRYLAEESEAVRARLI